MEGVLVTMLAMVLLPIPLGMEGVLATRLVQMLLTVSLVQTAATVMDVARHVMVVYLPMHATLTLATWLTLLMEGVRIAINSTEAS